MAERKGGRMRAVRIKKRLWIKPRTCPECGRFCIVARHYLSEHCDRCHRINAHRKKRERFRAKFGHPKGKYTSGYKAARKRLITEHPFCALCGTSENLTAHHIGGGLDKNKMTVLCNECHDAYERFNNKRKAKRCFQAVKSVILGSTN